MECCTANVDLGLKYVLKLNFGLTMVPQELCYFFQVRVLKGKRRVTG